jgi:hypothetical protein
MKFSLIIFSLLTYSLSQNFTENDAPVLVKNYLNYSGLNSTEKVVAGSVFVNLFSNGVPSTQPIYLNVYNSFLISNSNFTQLMGSNKGLNISDIPIVNSTVFVRPLDSCFNTTSTVVPVPQAVSQPVKVEPSLPVSKPVKEIPTGTQLTQANVIQTEKLEQATKIVEPVSEPTPFLQPTPEPVKELAPVIKPTKPDNSESHLNKANEIKKEKLDVFSANKPKPSPVPEPQVSVTESVVEPPKPEPVQTPIPEPVVVLPKPNNVNVSQANTVQIEKNDQYTQAKIIHHSVVQQTPPQIIQITQSNDGRDIEIERLPERLACIYLDSIEYQHFSMNYEKCKQLDTLYQSIYNLLSITSEKVNVFNL